MPFVVINGVSCFQGKMDQFISINDLENTFAFLENVYICGADQKDHDRCWNKYKKAARERNSTFNEEKSFFSTTKLQILGSIVENATIKPVPQRLQLLRNLPSPYDSKSMKRISHYSSGYLDFLIKFRY